MNPIEKARRATIYLGDIPLEVFLMPSGEYKLSQTQVAEAVGKEEVYVRTFLHSKHPEALPYKDYTPEKISVKKDHQGRGGTRISGIHIEVALAFWSKEWDSMNPKARALVRACAIESIERRADKEFGVQVEEEERNERMKIRIQGKITRRQLTDAIADYKLRHPELSANDKQWLFSNTSDAVNLCVFARRAKKLSKDFGVDPTRLRDSFTAEELLYIQEIEDVAVRLIDQKDIHPVTAVKKAAEVLLIPVQNRKQLSA